MKTQSENVAADRHHRSNGDAFNSISHLVGAVAALAGGSVLVVYASMNGDAARIVSFSIYGFTLFLLYLFSTLYHGLSGRARAVFQVLDHQAIYLLIAGTYTPVTLVTLNGSTGWWLFGAVWGLALIGMVRDVVWRNGSRVWSILIYLTMGWLSVLVIPRIIDQLSSAGFYWLLAGGLFYTVGVIFYLLGRRRPWAHGVWHVFVLAGSVCHYLMVMLYV